MDIGQEITSGKTESDFDVAALFFVSPRVRKELPVAGPVDQGMQ